MLGFEERENRSTQRKTSRSKERTNNKLNPHMTLGPGDEPGPHWWEASALTTTPPLLPKFRPKHQVVTISTPSFPFSRPLPPAVSFEGWEAGKSNPKNS